MTLPRVAALAVVLLALTLAPGCLNFILPDGGTAPPAQFSVEVRLKEVAPDHAFPLNRSDLEDLLANPATTNLNGLVYLLDEAASKGRPQSHVQLSETEWTAGMDRFGDLCRVRSSACPGQAVFTVVWKGEPIEVTFVRSLV